jgi:hypothetical protein
MMTNKSFLVSSAMIADSQIQLVSGNLKIEPLAFSAKSVLMPILTVSGKRYLAISARMQRELRIRARPR